MAKKGVVEQKKPGPDACPGCGARWRRTEPCRIPVAPHQSAFHVCRTCAWTSKRPELLDGIRTVLHGWARDGIAGPRDVGDMAVAAVDLWLAERIVGEDPLATWLRMKGDWPRTPAKKKDRRGTPAGRSAAGGA